MKTSAELAKEWLKKNSILIPKRNEVITKMKQLLGEDVPDGMSDILAIFTMAAFLAHLQMKLEIDAEEDNYVPMNVIGFILAKSGARKTSSIKLLQKALSTGLNKIEEIRDRLLKLKEQEIGEKLTKRPLDITVSTNPGMVAMYNAFAKEGIGSPSLIVDEIATELKTNANELVPNIKMAAQMFDDGDYIPKVIKDKERQEEAIKGMIMNCLFIGSEYTLLTDNKVLEMFMDEFMSKLSRRSLFAYPTFKRIEHKFNTYDEAIKWEEEQERKKKKLRKELRDLSGRIVDKFIQNDKRYIKISDEARRIWLEYKKANQDDKDVKGKPEYVVLEKMNRDWKMIKIAGVLTAFKEKDTVERDEVIEAITLVESLDGHLEKFVKTAQMTPAEKIAKLFENGAKLITFNDILKNKWAKNTREIEELITLVNSLLTTGTVEKVGTTLTFKPFEKVKKIGVSYKPVPGVKEVMEKMNMSKKEAKQYIAMNFATEGFKYVKANFKDFEDLLRNDCAYIPFRLKDGYRKNENVIGTSQLLVLDIDDSDIMDTEAHDILGDYNHMIARGSDKDNPYKFRILMPVDVEIDLEEQYWTNMYRLVGEDLSIEVDQVAKSQFFYGYKDREVLTNYDGENYPISKILPKAKEIETKAPKNIIYKATPAQEEAMWRNRAERYPETFNAKHGEEHKLFTMMCSLMDQGISEEMNKRICDDAIKRMPGKIRKGYQQSLDNQRRRKYAKKYKDQESLID